MTSRGRRKIWIAVLIPWLLSLAGCASEVVLTPDVDKVKPKLVLNEGEFRVVRTVSRARPRVRTSSISISPILFLGVVGISISAPPVAFALGDAAVAHACDGRSPQQARSARKAADPRTTSWRSGLLRTTSGLFAIRRLTITAEVLDSRRRDNESREPGPDGVIPIWRAGTSAWRSCSCWWPPSAEGAGLCDGRVES